MPRTMESLLVSHEVAAERRAAGKPVWDHRIQIKHLLSDDEFDANAQAVGREIARVVRASTWITADQERTRQHGGDSEVTFLVEEFEDIEGLNHFNAAMDRLYDLADADRTWVG